MAWSLYRWVWQVEAPLHIGTMPAGMLNRTRLYVPAQSLWGALTAELARLRAEGFPEYEKVGAELRENIRLSYLYPAEAVNGQWMAWLPRYDKGKGLVWEREDGGDQAEGERKFRKRLLVTRAGTAIEPEADSAAEGTLRELELISPFWRGDGPPFKRVALAGYIFCKNEASELKSIETLWVGGDIRYGLGRLKRLEWKQANSFFGQPVDLQGQEPVVNTSRVLAHTDASGITGNASPMGAMECLGGWDANGLVIQGLTWVPGSVFQNSQKSHDFAIQKNGLWRMR